MDSFITQNSIIMSIDMKRNFLKLLLHFRRQDLDRFEKEHNVLYEEATCTGHYLRVTQHYYSLMSTIIEEYFGGCFHFAPPSSNDSTLEEALQSLHRRLGEKLGLGEGVSCVDLGCGVGGVIRDIAATGASFTGVTIAPNEVIIGNTELKRMGFDATCKLVEGDCHNLPLDSGSQDAAYAIYALKYFPNLKPVLAQVSRVLRKGAKFAVYDLMTTDQYDNTNEKHTQGLEFACGMPHLHTRNEMIRVAAEEGLQLEEEEDLEISLGHPYHYCFSHSPLFMWLVQSSLIGSLISVGETLRILPKGFRRFNKIFLSGTVEKIVRGGEMGILSGGRILVFVKN